MEWDFRQGIGGQSFFQVQDRWVGCAFEGCAIFPGGRFQSRDFANKSVNLFRFARRLPPCCLLLSESDGKIVGGLGGIVLSASG